MSAQAQINLTALGHNLSIAKTLAPDARVLAVIKADAYGHGITQIADSLVAADGYAVANIKEGITLRQHGVSKKIIILQGFSTLEGLQTLLTHQLTPVIHTSQQLHIIRSAAKGQPMTVWLKIDTGMGRLGLSLKGYQHFLSDGDTLNTVHIECLMTHLASADEMDNPETVQQVEVFKTLVQSGDTISLANSAALLGWSKTIPELIQGWVRPGIMLYGISPFSDKTAQQLGLRPALTLTAPLIAINLHAKGDAIGYGGDWQCPEAMLVGVVSIGYGDGYPRHIQTGTSVLLNGKRATIIGRVSMDMLCLDLRGHEASIGDRVTCWGEGLPVEECALQAETIPYELMCQLTGRVQRVYT